MEILFVFVVQKINTKGVFHGKYLWFQECTRKGVIIMEIVYNDWSVTVYVTSGGDVALLSRVLEQARAEKVSFGSVGIVPLPAYCMQVSMEGVYQYIWFPHVTVSDVETLCSRSGVSLEGVPVVQVPAGL